MAFNMSNPSAVMSIYSSILNNEYNWLLLHYTNDSYDELALHSYGVEGLEELKTKLSNLQEVFIAFYREEVDVDAGYIIINYIPSSVSAVKRARVLVHSRRVGIVFKRHQAIYTVDNLSLITSHNVHQAITDPETFSSPTRHSPSKSADSTDKPLSEREHDLNIDLVPDHLQWSLQHVHSATRESPEGSAAKNARQPPSDDAPHLPLVYNASHMADLLKGGSLFKLLRRKKKDNSLREMESSLPPQTPSKDNGPFKIHPMLVTRSDIRPPRTDNVLQHQRSRSMSDCAVISHAPDSESMVIVQPESHDSYLQDNTRPHPLPLRGKWAHKGAISDPVERAHQRREVQLRREREEQELVEEEAERQKRLKLEKEMVMRQEKEEEAQRLAEVEQEISRIRLERRRREQSEKEEEEQHRRELEDRKRRDRKRRLEEHQRLEDWRRQQAQKLETEARQAAEIQRREEAKRREKIQLAEAVVKQTKERKELTGWITLQSRDTVSWRRRYYKFDGTTILFYRTAEDIIAPLEKIELLGNVSGLKEWYEGYEDLRALAFSFVVEFKSVRKPLSMYADCEEEKYKLLGLLRVAAGL